MFKSLILLCPYRVHFELEKRVFQRLSEKQIADVNNKFQHVHVFECAHQMSIYVQYAEHHVQKIMLPYQLTCPYDWRFRKELISIEQWEKLNTKNSQGTRFRNYHGNVY